MKVWISLRRVIAISEMIGLPRASRALERAKFAPNTTRAGASLSKSDETRLTDKVEVWAGICMIDRIAGMMFNLPSGTNRYQLPRLPVVGADGEVIRRGYLSSLAAISKEVYELDDSTMLDGSDAERYAEVLRIDQELISLASIPPPSWWSTDTPGILPDQVLKYWHSYLTIRVHLKFTLQKDGNQQFDYSRYTCMNACNIAITRYLTIRPAMPSGFFIGRIVDLQALTAAVVLLLAYHNSRSARRRNFQAQAIESPARLIAQLIEVMESLSCLRASDFATQAVVTIRSLSTLLEDDSASERQELTLTVPLLGKIHVHKNRNPIGNTMGQDVSSMVGLAPSQTTTGSQHFQPVFTPTTADFSGQAMPATNTSAWDPLSLFIEDDDREALFQSALVTEDYEQMDPTMNFSGFDFGGYA